jgi:hypothetical protein
MAPVLCTGAFFGILRAAPLMMNPKILEPDLETR